MRGIRTLVRRTAAILASAAVTLSATIEPASAQEQVVRAVLFYSPTCPHCHEVISEDLPRIFAAYGGEPQVIVNQDVPERERSLYYATNGQLEILLVDASRPLGYELYQTSTERFQIPRERSGVPRLVIADSVLVGSFEIPNHLPVIIEDALATDGLEWPDIEGLLDHLPELPVPPIAAREAAPPAAPDTATPVTPQVAPDSQPVRARLRSELAPSPADSPRTDTAAVPVLPSVPPVGEPPPPATLESVPVDGDSVLDRLQRDPLANGLAIAMLVVMIVSVIAVIVRTPRPIGRTLESAIPIVALIGIGVAGYLTYVELTGAAAVCGPVGDCNAVQQSSYARLFGVLPVGIVGLVGYVGIIAAWLVRRTGRRPTADWASFGLLLMTYVGTFFSIYLTYLEPFVIGATCAWCLTSAAIITLLLWLCAGSGLRAWERIRTGQR